MGGFSVSLDEARRLYLIEAAEKGIAWMKLTASGRAGHGSMLNSENAVTELAEAVARIGRHEWPVRMTPDGARVPRRGLRHRAGTADDAEALVAKLGPLARMIGATLRNTVNPTMLEAGYKANVIPRRPPRMWTAASSLGTRRSSSPRSTSCSVPT